MGDEPGVAVGNVLGLGGNKVGMLWWGIGQVFYHFVEYAEGGVDVDGLVGLAPGDREEVDVGAVLVVVSGAKGGQLTVQ